MHARGPAGSHRHSRHHRCRSAARGIHEGMTSIPFIGALSFLSLHVSPGNDNGCKAAGASRRQSSWIAKQELMRTLVMGHRDLEKIRSVDQTLPDNEFMNAGFSTATARCKFWREGAPAYPALVSTTVCLHHLAHPSGARADSRYSHTRWIILRLVFPASTV